MKKTLILILVAIMILTACDNKAQRPEAVATLPPISITEETIDSPNTTGQKNTNNEANNQTLYHDYNITLSVNPETGIVNGNQKVVYVNNSDSTLDNICFNMYINAFAMESPYQPYFSEFKEKIFPNGREYAYMNVSTVLSNGVETKFEIINNTGIEVKLDKMLAPGKTCELNLQFEAYIPQINHRTGSSEYAMWLGAFLPQLAVFENGSWRMDPYHSAGDPFYADTANYTVTVTTPTRCKVVGTGIESSKEENDKRITVLTAKLVRDFTFAVLYKDYTEVRFRTKSGVEVNLYYRSQIDDVNGFIKSAEASLDFFSTYVGGYPYSQIDIIETGMFLSGGMEFSQVIFIDSNDINQPKALKTLAHEIGHQWFYNIVGSDQINSPWMDEGMVSMLQEKIFYPNEEDYAGFKKKFESDYKALEKKLPDLMNLKLADSLGDYKNWTNYYNIQYIKGKLMIYALNMKMGEETFNRFIQTYYTRFNSKIATKDDFIAMAEEIYGKSLTAFFDAWLNGEDLPPLYD